MNKTKRAVGDTITWLGMNGHTWENEVTSFSERYGPSAPQWSARHSDQCRCRTEADAEPIEAIEAFEPWDEEY